LIGCRRLCLQTSWISPWCHNTKLREYRGQSLFIGQLGIAGHRSCCRDLE
jgi:hypothetical protein